MPKGIMQTLLDFVTALTKFGAVSSSHLAGRFGSSADAFCEKRTGTDNIMQAIAIRVFILVSPYYKLL
jgi:hypothetical protein